nr:molybdopterin synthase catalytic subunit like [Tanacetum cinerariifolium]
MPVYELTFFRFFLYWRSMKVGNLYTHIMLSVKMDGVRVQDVLKEFNRPRYEIKRHDESVPEMMIFCSRI